MNQENIEKLATNKETGARIKKCRIRKGLTQDELGKMVGVDQRRVHAWETGNRGIHSSILNRIAANLGTTGEYLATFTDHEGSKGNEWRYIIANSALEKLRHAQSDLLAFNVDSLGQRNINESCIALLKSQDDALHKTIAKNDLVLIDKSKSEVVKPAIFAIATDSGEIWLRWMRPEINGDVTIYCDEKEHFPDSTLTKEQLKKLDIVGQVIGHWHWN
ncbi:helix-turn-helix domain-containing protein [Motilimonas cestriensis]|uniref:Helix-turn-helix domain-containing protein n=1 Tax=Motilimonas cestriensis TaxID=2742685 RepID=A0ABS8WHR2_9GAMM|nr:helix-turn-helix domain-containing protein [Motilimonas cestriensis]MCE2597169.1 helix-turn-helix domain-containing protein [Motilimonas cestriensis]